jgi:hypothetical protein
LINKAQVQQVGGQGLAAAQVGQRLLQEAVVGGAVAAGFTAGALEEKQVSKQPGLCVAVTPMAQRLCHQVFQAGLCAGAILIHLLAASGKIKVNLRRSGETPSDYNAQRATCSYRKLRVRL